MVRATASGVADLGQLVAGSVRPLEAQVGVAPARRESTAARKRKDHMPTMQPLSLTTSSYAAVRPTAVRCRDRCAPTQ